MHPGNLDEPERRDLARDVVVKTQSDARCSSSVMPPSNIDSMQLTHVFKCFP
jgi:hypothetical protein